MILKVEKSAFLNAIKFVSQAAGNRSTPICDTVRLQASNDSDKLIFSATTLATSAQTSCLFDTNNSDINTLDICVDVNALKNYVSKISDYVLTFCLDEPNQTFIIQHSSGTATFPYFDGIEFPRIFPDFSKSPCCSVDMTAPTLYHILNTSKNFLSTDPLRPTLMATNIEFQANTLSYCATDAHKFIKETFTYDTISSFPADTLNQILIPRDCFALVCSIPNIDNAATALVADYEDKIFINVDTANGSYSICAPKIEGKFPNTAPIVAKASNNDKIFKLDKNALSAALERAISIPNKSMPTVRFDCNIDNSNAITLTSEDLDANRKQVESLEVLDPTTKSITFGVNGQFFKYCLQTVSNSQYLLVSANNPTDAITIVDPFFPNKCVICMPVAL